MTLEPGIRGEQSVSVTAANTAKTMGSGTLDVFATPALVALAEKTCWMSVAPALAEGDGTVGTKLELEHTAPTPVGMTVTCESELVAVEGRKLTFKVSLHDEKGPVGGGTHERFVIHNDKFAAKADLINEGFAVSEGARNEGPASCHTLRGYEGDVGVAALVIRGDFIWIVILGGETRQLHGCQPLGVVRQNDGHPRRAVGEAERGATIGHRLSVGYDEVAALEVFPGTNSS